MTLSGTVQKTGVLLVHAVASAFFTQFAATHNPTSVSLEMIVGVFGGLVFALITAFKREWSPVTAPTYALLEGLFLGAFSAMLDLRYPGIAIQAVGLTFATLFVLLFAYSTGVIKDTQKFRLGIVAATGGICLFYFAEMISNNTAKRSLGGEIIAPARGSGASTNSWQILRSRLNACSTFENARFYFWYRKPAAPIDFGDLNQTL
jgi:uncharacterized YccA/Bax inhibitor family protein